MDLLSHYKDEYHFEIQRSEIFDSRLQVPTAAIIVLISFLAYIFEKVNFFGEPVGVATFGVIYVFSVLITFVSVCFLVVVWGGSKYKFLPLPKDLELHRKDLKNYFSEDDLGQNTIDLYKNNLLNYYVECASFNSDINQLRARRLYLGVIAMSAASVMALTSYVPYYSYNLEKDETVKIEVVSDIARR
ncbi:hypothetical protein [Moritella sp. F3]|uniref:hypothetical protein n=1 Tax=Moritella sp. F3 TaxID=2718882 RepID=UPI0018E0EAD6|nr:hypothetical protein [Moritella sp. F3]GIC79338.1 hypothetical protein FMO001_40650 [Moritella sp. F1]GIC84057.1 hypothetical protein FMO003_43370 [Moritella sp. F3]